MTDPEFDHDFHRLIPALRAMREEAESNTFDRGAEALGRANAEAEDSTQDRGCGAAASDSGAAVFPSGGGL